MNNNNSNKNNMEIIKKELGIPEKYLKHSDGRIAATVHRNWINSFLTEGPIHFLPHKRLTADEIVAQPSAEELGPNWMRIYVKVYPKLGRNAIPLPKGRNTVNARVQTELTFAQMLRYVAETNYRNLWKEVFKKYTNAWGSYEEQREQTNTINITNDTAIMQEVIARMYGCTLVQVRNGTVVSVVPNASNEVHCNLLPVLFAVETPNSFMTFHEETAKYSLRECVTYSPAALSTSHGKPLFLVYQLLRLSRHLHDLGLALGEVTLSDILLMDNLTIQVFPKLRDNVYKIPVTSIAENQSQKESMRFRPKSLNAGNPDFGSNESIEKLCEMWVQGRITNYDYLTALNNLAGRRYGDPSCHHVMPWVTDFTSRCGGNWRDLTKSKFRLNKGDRQLDLTFDTQSSEVGHHVSDVLSEITYYVYLSRRYTRSVLCKHVRPLWVPWEYPVSIQRLHDWSPDECIPQFFSDPSVFKSIHEDLPDLEIPAWATSPEDFIAKHREALESFYVSERLHQWIDLTFGYKLSGSAAVKSKNVCLQLVDNHTSLTNSGVVQLFTQPHPQKIVPSPYWSKTAPRLRTLVLNGKTKAERSGEKISEDEGHSSGLEEEESPITALNTSRSSPLALSRLLSRSRGSLLSTEDSTKIDKSSNQTIILPKDYNPVAALVQLETMHTFMNKVNNKVYKPKLISHDGTMNFKQIVACARIKEQQILGCLIVEIFLSNKLRATWNVEKMSFDRRLNVCLNTLRVHSESLPKCVRNAVALLLQVDIIPKSYNLDSAELEKTETPFRYPTITFMGLPPPSAHQLLQPVLSGSLFPSSKYFQHLFNVVQMLQEYNSLVRELNFITYSEESNEYLKKTRIKFLCKISECKVKAVARELERLLSYTGEMSTTEASLQLVVPHIKQIMGEPYSAVLAAWHLFDPIAKALGPKETAKTFLVPIVKLYENGSIMDSWSQADSASFPAGSLAKFKTMRLYHRSFLLKLIVRLGLRRFLQNFITPLVEAVGGYRDHLEDSTSSSYHRSGNLKTCDLGGNSGDEVVLSPLDDDSSADSENNVSSPPATVSKYELSKIVVSVENEVEEVFTMETEENTSPANETIDVDVQLDLSHLSFNDDPLEEGNEITSPSGSVKSPTIPIPTRTDSVTGKLVRAEFNSIGCHVGSKTSNEDTPFASSYTGVTITTSGSVPEMNPEIESKENTDVEIIRAEELVQSREMEGTTELKEFPMERKLVPECKVSEMSAESIIWLSHRLGPVLTARYLSRNLLRMLTLCYAGRENLTPIANEEFEMDGSIESVEWKRTVLAGDLNASKVLECLAAIAGLYGEQIILVQYFAHVTELLTLCKRRLTPNLEGGLVSCLALLIYVVPCLSDSALMNTLQETIVKAILHPTVRILSTTRYTYPSGTITRSALAEKYLEAIFTLAIRLGSVITKSHLTAPIQRFFLAFDKAFALNDTADLQEETQRTLKTDNRTRIHQDDNPSQIWSGVNDEIADSYSPPIIETDEISAPQRKAIEELRSVFTIEMAHKSYVLFYGHVGEEIMNEILRNHQLIQDLCNEYEQTVSPTNAKVTNFVESFDASDADNCVDKGFEGFGNISVIGNRIEVQESSRFAAVTNDSSVQNSRDAASSSFGRQLRGNWLAYWEHEIGRPDKDTTFNIKQIKLQSFGGHTNSVRCLNVLDNENSFMSGSRDKSVKLWSLRSQGDGSTVSSCQYTYTGHKKSILALTFLESLRYAVTCDGVIHCWDPFLGSLVGYPESPRPTPVNSLAASPAPSATLLVGTTDITLRVIDCRTFQYVNEMKVSMNPTGLIRCIAVAPSGHWVALGQASGFLTILDIRTGLIIASWKGHECEILQLQAVDDTSIISSSLDQTIAVWSAVDGKLKFHMKGATEPVHCMAIYEQQLVTGTTANRIGVHTSVDATATFSSSKLRSDAFKGVLTAMSILPLNRLLLLGADNGGITLLC